MLKQKFLEGGLDALKASDALELLLSYSSPNTDVCALATSLIGRFKGLRGVLDAAPNELMGAGDIDEKTAAFIRLVKEVGGVYFRERIIGRGVEEAWEDMLGHLFVTLSGQRVEKFIAIYLDAAKKIISVETLHEGTLNQTVVYPRKVIESAFRKGARGMVLVHNHPSGDPAPSEADRELMLMLDTATAAVDLYCHDHLIIGRNTHYSERLSGVKKK